jgi:hypothetical protein
MTVVLNPFTGKLELQSPGGGGGTVTSVSGTANRITSTSGATPVIDIAATYVGQASLTTLGTITTGTWNGTPTYPGSVSGTTPATGFIGQVLSANVPSGSAVPLTNATAANITSLLLTPGNWMVTGIVAFQGIGASSQLTEIDAGINIASATLTTINIDYAIFQVCPPGGGSSINFGPATICLATPIQYISVLSNTLYYLNAKTGISVGTAAAYGKMQAVRIG